MGFVNVGEGYIGETKKGTIKRWSKYDNPTKGSKPTKCLNRHINHVFTWKTLRRASKKTDIRNNLETIITALLKPS